MIKERAIEERVREVGGQRRDLIDHVRTLVLTHGLDPEMSGPWGWTRSDLDLQRLLRVRCGGPTGQWQKQGDQRGGSCKRPGGR